MKKIAPNRNTNMNDINAPLSFANRIPILMSLSIGHAIKRIIIQQK